MLARTCAKAAGMAGFINASEISEGTLCICLENASGSESISIGIVVVANEKHMVGDMEAEESREVVAEEESTITMGPVGEGAARWTEMSTLSGEVVTMA